MPKKPPKEPPKEPFPTARPSIPDGPTLGKLRQAAATCTGCDLYRNASALLRIKGESERRLAFDVFPPGT